MSDEKVEIERLRDLLRWRDAKKEPPTENGLYAVFLDGRLSSDYWYEHWCELGRRMSGPTHWRPIGTLPDEGGE